MQLSRRTLIQLSLAAGLIALLAGIGEIAKWDAGLGPRDAAGWRPIAWPLAADDRPAGKSWRGHELEIHVRPKLGHLAQCDGEIADDAALARASDIALLDADAAPVAAGRRIRITDLFGRARLHRARVDGAARQVEAIAVSFECHLLTALVVGRTVDEAKFRTARQFLESNTVQIWINQQFGSR